MQGTSLLFAGMGSVFTGLAVLVLVLGGAQAQRRGVLRSLAAIASTSSGESGRSRALPFTQRVLVPALEQFADVGHRLSPRGAVERLARQLDLAGNPALWPLQRVMAIKAVGVIVAVPLSLWITSSGELVRGLLLAGAGGAAAFFIPDLLIYNAGQKRQHYIQQSLADALDLLTVSVEAGLGFDAALAQVARNTEGPLASEFFRVLQEMQIGKSRGESFRALGERSTVPDLTTFVSSLVQADALGIPIARVLREQSKEMRLKRRQRAEEKAMKVPVKILFPMVVFILPVLFVVILAPGAISIFQTIRGG